MNANTTLPDASTVATGLSPVAKLATATRSKTAFQNAPNTTLQKDMPHEGEEFGYVLDGEIEIVIGNNVYKCKKRNSFYFVSNKVHYIKNTKNTTAKIIWVSSPPTF